MNSVLSAVFIPLLQALASGSLSGLLVGLLASVSGVPSPGTLGLIAGVFVSFYAWLKLLSRWGRLQAFQITGQLVATEEQPQLDTPQPAPAPLRIEVIQEEGRLQQWAELEASPEQLEALARGIIRYGQSFSEDSWTGSHRAFSRQQFRQLRDVFINRGWLAWKDVEAHSQGLEVTYAGRAVLKHFCDVTISPALLEARRHPGDRT